MNNWLAWIRELKAIAQTGLNYATDIYDVERYEQIKKVTDHMLASLLEQEPQVIEQVYYSEKGHQTPKVDTRVAVWKDDKILLVQENDGLWAMPGGWMDVTETISSNAKKEVFEESGSQIEVKRLVAIHDRNRHNPGQNVFTILKVFVEAEYQGGQFQANSETKDARFFDVNDLPQLMERKTSKAQIELCYQARMTKDWQVQFD